MGYTTEFTGQIKIDPPLTPKEAAYLAQFAASRRMSWTQGPYYVEGDESPFGPTRNADIIDYNQPPDGQPGLWCQWVPTEDGSAIEWDGGEKFYNAPEWMAYLRSHFIVLGAAGLFDPSMDFFSKHSMAGEIIAVGEDYTDVWKLSVDDSGVHLSAGTWADGVFSESDQEDGIYGGDAVELANTPGNVVWDAPERVPDFESPSHEERWLAACEAKTLDGTIPKKIASGHSPSL